MNSKPTEHSKERATKALAAVSKEAESKTVTITHPNASIGSFQITDEQYRALHTKFEQGADEADCFEEFLGRVRPCGFGADQYIGLRWCGMWLGIERDGYTHS